MLAAMARRIQSGEALEGAPERITRRAGGGGTSAQKSLMRRTQDHAIATFAPETAMKSDLHDFLADLARTVTMTLVPVVLIAFLSMPMSLNRHPGELPPETDAPIAHMT